MYSSCNARRQYAAEHGLTQLDGVNRADLARPNGVQMLGDGVEITAHLLKCYCSSDGIVQGGVVFILG